jgi:hypothetical protein
MKRADYGKGPNDPRRTLKEVDLVEVSIVDQPSNALARIEGVKSDDPIEGIDNLRDAENYLRDAGGLSRTEAKAYIARLSSLGQRDADGGVHDAVLSLRRRLAVFALGA